MLSYATIGVNNLEKSEAFYNELLAPMGAKTLFKMDRIIFMGKSMKAPMLAICIPFNKEQQSSGNGNMVAIAMDSKEQVDEMYKKAIALGASCEGAPGQRIPNVFYGAYFRDVDGNKLAFSYFG